MPMTRSNCCRCWERIKVRSPPRIWMHTWTSSPFASTAGNRAVGECSSIACWKMPSQHSQRDIGLQEPTKQHQNTTCSGYCTKAATPLERISSTIAIAVELPISSLELDAIMLHHAPDGRQVVVGRLHRPDRVSLGTEGLRGVCFHAHIDRYRLSILVNDVASGVVVTVAAAIVRSQNRKVHSVCRVGIDACRDQPEVWVPGVAHQHIRALRIP